jgi:hypothetical protein
MIKRTGGLWEGYTIYATHFLSGEEMASYTEADNTNLALERCEIQFPAEDGWGKHWVRNQRTKAATFKDEILPLT